MSAAHHRLGALLVLAALFLPAGAATAPDSTPPVITYRVAGTDGANGWYTSNATLSWTYSDAESGIKASSGCDTATVTADTAGARFTCSATNQSDVTSSVSVLIKRDATAPDVTSATPQRGPDSTGWYTRPVSITFAGSDATSGVDACTPATYSSPDSKAASVSGLCRDRAGNASAPRAVSFQYDATPPEVTSATPERAPDSNGWYTRPVSIAFAGSDATAGVDACTPATYSSPDSKAASVSGLCRDQAGNASAPRAVSFQYDATPPEVTAANPDRPPNSGGWYTKPVTLRFAGEDTTSGVESCAPVTYSGPDLVSASVAGTCRDAAGHTSAPRVFPFKFDATPPRVSALEVKVASGTAMLAWQSSPDAEYVEVLRSPGRAGAGKTRLYRGRARRFVDRRVTNGVRYRYVVVGYDRAGNAASGSVLARPHGPLVAPPGGATVRKPPLLTWTKVRRATYYNVQLYRGKRKIMTLWPLRPQLRLRASWRHAGRRYRLVPGRYRWYVWPGYGVPSKRRYGKLLGASSFVVR